MEPERWRRVCAAAVSLSVKEADVSDVDAKRQLVCTRSGARAHTYTQTHAHIYAPTVIQTPVVYHDLTSAQTQLVQPPVDSFIFH